MISSQVLCASLDYYVTRLASKRLLSRAIRSFKIRTIALGLVSLPAFACSAGGAGDARTITVFNAGAIARPLRVALDSFSRADSLNVLQESAGSLETVRKITELGRTPDVVALADTALFSRFLAAAIAGPVVPLGRTRMVLAYTPKSRFSKELSAANWYQILTRPGVETGRSDPTLDPGGYRALFVMQLAQRYYKVPGLAAKLEAAAPARNIRPKSADLVALLQTGNLDYAWEYEAVALSSGLNYVRLPAEIDLGEAADAASYATAKFVLPTRGSAPSMVLTGAPIVFGAATLKAASHGTVGQRFITYMTSAAGRAVLANYHMEPIP
ncbi:MAG: extracellular solute-binding protein [Gemmatimonadaceae bacterium]